MYSVPLWIAIAIAVLFGLPGFFLLRGGLRGRQVHDRPLCAGCGYDLSGQAVDSVRCPECGQFTNLVGAIKDGEFAKRPGLVTTGCISLLCAASAVTLWSVGYARTINWIAIKPAWWLAIDAENAGGSLPNLPLNELNRRLNKGEIDGSDVQNIVQRGLRIQGDSTLPWNPGWGDFVELAHQHNLVNDENWNQYVHQVLKTLVRLKVRKTIRIGDPIPYRIERASPRVASRSVLSGYWTHDCPLRAGDAIIQDGTISSCSISLSPRGGTWSRMTPGRFTPGRPMPQYNRGDIVLPFENDHRLTPAQITISTDVIVKVVDGPAGRELDQSKVLLSETLTLTDMINVLPATESSVITITDSSRRPQLTLKMRSRDRDGVQPIELVYGFDSRQTDIAFDVFLRHGPDEIRAGSIRLARGASISSMSETFPGSLELVREGSGFIFRPSIDLAKQTVDCFEIWGEPLEFTNVKIENPQSEVPYGPGL